MDAACAREAQTRVHDTCDDDVMPLVERALAQAELDPLGAEARLAPHAASLLVIVSSGASAKDGPTLERALVTLIALDEPCWQRGASYATYARLFDELLSHPLVERVHPTTRARALVARARTRAWRLDEAPRGTTEATLAVELASAARASKVLGLALRTRALIALFEGRVADARADVGRALDIARTLTLGEGGSLLGLTLSLSGLVHRFEGDLAAARDLLERARAFYADQGNRILGAMVSIDLVYVLLGAGALDEARALVTSVADEEDALRARRSPYLALARGVVLLVSLSFDEARASFELARELGDGSGETVLALTARVYAALASFALGESAEAEVALMEVAGFLGLGPQPFYASLAWGVASALQAARGRSEEARALLRRANASPAQSPFEARCIGLCAAYVERGELPREVEPEVPEARILASVLARAAAPHVVREHAADFVVHHEARWLRASRGAPIDLRNRPVMRRILAALCEARARGAWLDKDALAAAGWPGERMLDRARKNRVHVMISRLRELGLDGAIEASREGYRLSPRVQIEAA